MLAIHAPLACAYLMAAEGSGSSPSCSGGTCLHSNQLACHPDLAMWCSALLHYLLNSVKSGSAYSVVLMLQLSMGQQLVLTCECFVLGFFPVQLIADSTASSDSGCQYM